MLFKAKKESSLVAFKARPKKWLSVYVFMESVKRVNGSVRDVMKVGVGSCVTRKHSHQRQELIGCIRTLLRLSRIMSS